MAQETGRAEGSQVAAKRVPDAADESDHRWLILFVVCLGQLMVVLDSKFSSVNVDRY